MLEYEDWLFETGKEDSEDTYWEYIGYKERIEQEREATHE